ncbi:MAG: hypothetical protein ABR886_06330 [Dehalococcoidales bacterium]|jgi:hypothetical protein
MEYKTAVDILKKMADKYPLAPEEKEALMTAVGVLVWGSLAKSRMKGLKAKRENRDRW